MIAWPEALDSVLLPKLRDMGLEGVELAPTRVWPDWSQATPVAAEQFRRELGDLGLWCPALQSVLYGRPDLSLFASTRRGQRAFRDHMVRIADLAASAGASTVVLGSPRNRDPGQLSAQDAWAMALARLAPIADEYAARGVALGLEANPEEYECRFITRIADALRLVEELNSPGLRLHADAGALALTGEPFMPVIERGRIAHVHVSEPFLGAFDHPHDAVHGALAAGLRGAGYEGWASIEMRTTSEPEVSLQQAVAVAERHYGAVRHGG